MPEQNYMPIPKLGPGNRNPEEDARHAQEIADRITAEVERRKSEKSPTSMRAKVKCESVTVTEYGERLAFKAVCKSGSYPADGADEDNTFAKFSPSADFSIDVRNPALFGQFKPGMKFYVDFTEAEK